METMIEDVTTGAKAASPLTPALSPTGGEGATLPAGVSIFRLGVYAHNPSDARSLSRLLGPFNAMARQDARLQIVNPRLALDGSGWDLDWSWTSACDAVCFLDPYTKDDVRRVGLARSTGTKVWVDYCDDLTSVRKSNPVWMNYANAKQVLECLTRIIGMADVATVTTATIKARFPFSEKLMVLPESCRWPQAMTLRERVITWRGFGSHNEDLESVLPQLRELSRLPQFGKWDWAFIGEPIYKIFDDIIPPERLVYAPPMTPFDLMNRWGGMRPYLHIVPLADHAFNRGKTPLAWLEASAIGAAVVARNLPEWAGCEGLLRYDTPEEFGQVLRRAMEQFDAGKLHPAALASRRDIYPARTLETVNAQRWGILRNLAAANGRE